MKYALLLLFTTGFAFQQTKDKIIWHYDHPKQLSCKVTKKATRDSDYQEITCLYRCDHPRDSTFDANTHEINVACEVAEEKPAAISECRNGDACNITATPTSPSSEAPDQ